MSSISHSADGKKQRFALLLKIAALLLLAALFIFAVTEVGLAMGELLKSVLAAGLLAYLLFPLNKALQKHFPIPFSAAGTVIITFGGIAIITYLLVPALINEAEQLSEQKTSLVAFVTEAAKGAEEKLLEFGISVDIGSLVSRLTTTIAESAGLSVSSLINGIFSFIKKVPSLVLIPILTFYFLKDSKQILRGAEFVIPIKARAGVRNTLSDANRIIKQYVRTQLTVAFIVGAATAVGYFIVGVPYALIFGLFMGICEIIPYFGPLIGAVPVCLLVLISSPDKILWTIAVVAAVQQLEGDFLSPYIMGTHFDIHPVTVIIILWVSGSLLGFAGFLFGIPIFVIVKNITVATFNRIVKAG